VSPGDAHRPHARSPEGAPQIRNVIPPAPYRRRFRAAAQWIKESAGHLAPCLGAKRDGDAWRIMHKPRAVALTVARKGYSVVVTRDAKAPAGEVLADYRARDQVEKLFDVLKNENGQGRLRTGDDTVAAGRLFVAFVGTILRLSLEDGMRRCGLLERMSVPEAFAALRKVRTLLAIDGRRHHLEIPKKTRDILAALQIPPPK